ncbi:CpaD family pilus assembly protein [Caenibius sp. WL]|uniref:CpaD family pilus assembly protein n=1 Tax=Caenibius sp. WL TaxID=2872646 RepID=UPI001C99182E|nr:CpaD family pilus assembly protein [Caenibius sp. WL]QZP08002.1 CpaD family pilus assembly protein [Caenibius sp. WL]
MRIRTSKPLALALLAAAGFTIAGCDSTAYQKRGLESIHQPIVSRNTYTLDLVTGGGGLSATEQNRLAEWFETMDLRYGDRVAIDDPNASTATRSAVNEIAGRFGLLVAEGAPVTPGEIYPGNARVVVTRSTATVPGCPDWSDSRASNLGNQTASGFGCAVNSNLAAMVANPEDLVRGERGTGQTVMMSSNKAIDSYRRQKPTGTQSLVKNATSDGGN